MFQILISTDVRGNVESPDKFNVESVAWYPSSWSNVRTGVSTVVSSAHEVGRMDVKSRHKTSESAVLVLFNIHH